MASVEVQQTGPDLERLLKQLPITLRAKSLGQAARAAGGVVRTRARQLVPIGDPRHNPDAHPLKDTVKVVVRYYDNDRRAVAVVGPRYPQGAHGHLVEKGHKVVVSRGPRKGQRPLSGSPYVKGKEFLAPAADQTKPQQQAAVVDKLQKLIKKAEDDAKRSS